MALVVTYDGVEGAKNGTIFKDVKFWVAQRVPQRPRWVELIKQNGGSVVPLERQADMLIADYRRAKEAPHGSYSWRFIEDSVKNGCIQLTDRYLIGSHPDEPKRVGSSHPSKSTRTPFTKEDDARLAKWALEHPTEQKGNKIWEEYAQINDRHTAQSWRDHYIKKLQHLDRSLLERMAASAPADTIPGDHTTDQAEPPSNVAGRSLQQPATQQPPKRKQQNDNTDKPRPLDTAPTRSEEASPPPTTEQAERPVQLPQLNTDLDDEARDAFYYDLDIWIASTDNDVKRRFYIKETPVETYDLVRAIQIAEGDTVDWVKVAGILGFVNPDSHLLNELHQFYEENIRDFLESMQNFESDGEEEPKEGGELASDSEAIAPEADLAQEIEWGDGQDYGHPQSYERSSPPVAIAGSKQSAEQRGFTSIGNAKKRRRFGPDEEIPSTPEAALAPEIPTRDPSPSALVSSQWRDYIGESEASQHLPPLPPQQDESQDLGVTAAPRQEPRQESTDAPPMDDATLDATPIPFHLNKKRQERPSASRRREPSLDPWSLSDSSSTDETTPRRAVPLAKPDSKPTTQSAVRRSLPSSFRSSRNPTSRNPPLRDSLPHDSDKSNSREIQKWISHYESEGYPRRIVIEGLKRTTLTPGKLALLVMKHLSEGRDVPSRHEGIWTDRDDKDLEFASSVDFDHSPVNDMEEQEQALAQKAHNRLVRKHGKQRFELRKAFLEAQITEGRLGTEH
ncbi:hypothetical protein FLONG3_2352 [Fusarium longipes]|uniref:DNA-binding protein RAP1 n=1 Tax=Fusarium longipes TaxID=694270 RepID=A0A395T4F2_9HYPO|nr:hypothetical protein FLONG3_2352 [Fusarium longipes]